MVDFSAGFQESDNVPTVAEMDALVEKVNNVCARAVLQECSNFTLAKRCKNRRRSASVTIAEGGISPVKNSGSLKKNKTKMRSFAKHLSKNKTESGNSDAPCTSWPTEVPEQSGKPDASKFSSSDISRSSEDDKTEAAAEDKAETSNVVSEAGVAPVPSFAAEQAKSGSAQPTTEKANATTAVTSAGEMAATPATTVRPRANRNERNPAKLVTAYKARKWERKRVAPVESLTAAKRIKLQDEFHRGTAAAMQLLEHVLRLSSDDAEREMGPD